MKKIKQYLTISTMTLGILATANYCLASTSLTEESGIEKAKSLYTQAVPMPVDSEKRQELLKQSEAILKDIIAKDQNALDAHRKLMGVYLLKQDYSNAIRTIKDAITLSPEDPKLFITLAFLYEHSGALEYAKEILNQALELDPSNKLAKDYQLVIQQKIGQRKVEQAHDGQKITGSPH